MLTVWLFCVSFFELLLKDDGFWGVAGVKGVGVGGGLSASADGVAAVAPVVEGFLGRYDWMSVIDAFAN